MRFLCRFAACLLVTAATAATLYAQENPKVLMKTSMGDLTIELYEKEAPKTVENFLKYVEDDFYEGTVFHRIIDGFVVQGGGFQKDLERKETRKPIPNESSNGLKNKQYTLSMARTSDPGSATSQFFINLVDNEALDKGFPQGDGHGYAVFGKVVEGMDVVDKMGKVETTTYRAKGMQDIPVKPIVVESAEVITGEEAEQSAASKE